MKRQLSKEERKRDSIVFCELMRRVREEQNMTQDSLAECARMGKYGPSNINHYEKGRKVIGRELALKITKCLELDQEEIPESLLSDEALEELRKKREAGVVLMPEDISRIRSQLNWEEHWNDIIRLTKQSAVGESDLSAIDCLSRLSGPRAKALIEGEPIRVETNIEALWGLKKMSLISLSNDPKNTLLVVFAFSSAMLLGYFAANGIRQSGVSEFHLVVALMLAGVTALLAWIKFREKDSDSHPTSRKVAKLTPEGIELVQKVVNPSIERYIRMHRP